MHLPMPVVRVERLHWRLALAAVGMGAVGAFAAALVRLGFRGLEWLLTQSSAAEPIAGAHLPPWRRVLTPVLGGLLAALVLAVRRRRALGLGREPRPYVEYVEAARHRHGAIPLLPNCWRTLSAAFSVASGAAVGREGSMIQFASTIASASGRWVQDRLGGAAPLELSLLVAFGAAGGVTAAYNAPVAAVFFAAEIVLGGLAWRELGALGLASAAGWLVAGGLLGFGRLYPAHVALRGGGWALALLPALALALGALGPGYQWLIGSLRAARRLPLALAWSGLLVGLLSLADPRVWGNGDLGLSAALGRAEVPGLSGLSGFSVTAPALAALLGLRLVATTVCVGTGTVGGVFTPTLFVGGVAAALGAHLARHCGAGADTTLWAIAGMSCLLAAVTHAPIMAALMAVELTGNWLLLPLLLLLNAMAWQLARRLSPHALYAIASQAPTRRPGGTPPV